MQVVWAGCSIVLHLWWHNCVLHCETEFWMCLDVSYIDAQLFVLSAVRCCHC